MMDSNELRGPIFVKVDEYNKILQTLEMIKGKVNEAKATLENIKELKKEEDSEIDLWSVTLQDIEKKLNDMDQELMESDSAGEM